MNKRTRTQASLAAGIAVVVLGSAGNSPAGPPSLQVRSPAFAAGESIPAKYTCSGSDTSPPLEWSKPPDGTRSLALIVDDPDAPDPAAPKRTWVHWVVYNIAPETTSLAEGAGNAPLTLPAVSGLNDWSRPGYGGPCPPIGRHRYFFRLYALDARLEDLDAPTRRALDKAMASHVLAAGELMGTFEK